MEKLKYVNVFGIEWIKEMNLVDLLMVIKKERT